MKCQTLQKDDSILQQKISQGQLSLTLIGLIGMAAENLVGREVVRDWKIHTGLSVNSGLYELGSLTGYDDIGSHLQNFHRC